MTDSSLIHLILLICFTKWKQKKFNKKISPSVRLYIIKLISYLQKIDPTCEALSLVNGQIDYSDSALTAGEYPVDTVASFTCDFRYYLSGAGSITCQTSGKWNAESPMCKSNKSYALL